MNAHPDRQTDRLIVFEVSAFILVKFQHSNIIVSTSIATLIVSDRSQRSYGQTDE